MTTDTHPHAIPAGDLAWISPSLRALAHPLALLREDGENANLHDERSIRSIAESLARFGQQKPIVAVRGGRVIAGNGTLRAARHLGHRAIAVNWLEDESQARAFAIADNRTAQLASWDLPELERQLPMIDDELDLDALGFGADDLDALGLGSLEAQADAVEERYLEDFDPTPKPRPRWALVSAPADLMPLVEERLRDLAARGVRVEVQRETRSVR